MNELHDMKTNNNTLTPDSLEKDQCLLARCKLSLGRPDLSLRQSTAEATAKTFGREAAGRRTLGNDAGSEFHLCAFEPGHQEV